MQASCTPVELDDDEVELLFRAPATCWGGRVPTGVPAGVRSVECEQSSAASLGFAWAPTVARLELTGLLRQPEDGSSGLRDAPSVEPTEAMALEVVPTLVEAADPSLQLLLSPSLPPPQHENVAQQTASSSLWRLQVQEELKFLVSRGGEVKGPQRVGVVRAARLEAGGAATTVQLSVKAPPETSIVVNPNLAQLQKQHEDGPGDATLYTLTLPAQGGEADLPVVLLKYKPQHQADVTSSVPQAVRAKASLKSSASVVLMQVDLAFNSHYVPHLPVFSECSVSLKALDALVRVVDARGKQPAGFLFSYSREQQVLTWSADSAADPPALVAFDKVLSFFARIETQDVSSKEMVLPPILVALLLPTTGGLGSSSCSFSLLCGEAGAAPVSCSTKLEYQFL